jgi:hypothetical protein
VAEGKYGELPVCDTGDREFDSHPSLQFKGTKMISQEARDLLAAIYDRDKLPWFASDIRNAKGKQYDRSLEVITDLLNIMKVS